MYTKKDLAETIVKFINNDLMNDIDDKHLKFSLCIAKKALHENPDVLDAFLDSPIISSVIKEVDGEYNIDSFVRTLKSVLSEYGTYSVVIPKIPMFAPNDSEIKITAEDIDKMLMYLKEPSPVS